MTIRKMFIVVFAIVLVTTLTGAFFVFKMTSNQGTSKAILNFFKITNSHDTDKNIDKTADEAVVNLAERQRMLIQKYSKEYIHELIPLQVRHSLLARSEDKEFGTDSFLKTKKAFDMTLDALINGGKAPLDLEMTKFTALPPTQDSKIRNKLYEVKRSWNTVQEDTKKLREVEPYSSEYIAAFDDAYISAYTAMKIMNEAVNMYPVYPRNSEDKTKMATLLWFQGGSVGVVVLIIILGWLFFKETATGHLHGSDQITFATERSTEQASSMEPEKKKHNAYNSNREASLASLQKLMKTSRY